MREIRQSGSEGGGTNPIVSPYPYSRLMPFRQQNNVWKFSIKREPPRRKAVASASVFDVSLAVSVNDHGTRPWHVRLRARVVREV